MKCRVAADRNRPNSANCSGDYWELNPDLRNHNPGHYHYAIVTMGRDGVEPSPSGFSDQCYRPHKLSSQSEVVPIRIELILSPYQRDFLPLKDGTISGQDWTRTNDVSLSRFYRPLPSPLGYLPKVCRRRFELRTT